MINIQENKFQIDSEGIQKYLDDKIREYRLFPDINLNVEEEGAIYVVTDLERPSLNAYEDLLKNLDAYGAENIASFEQLPIEICRDPNRYQGRMQRGHTILGKHDFNYVEGSDNDLFYAQVLAFPKENFSIFELDRSFAVFGPTRMRRRFQGVFGESLSISYRWFYTPKEMKGLS